MQLCRVQISGERDCPLSLHLRGQQTVFSSLTNITPSEPSTLFGLLTLSSLLVAGETLVNEELLQGEEMGGGFLQDREGACFPRGHHRGSTASMAQPLLALRPGFRETPFLPGHRVYLVTAGTDASRYISHFWAKLRVWYIVLCWVCNPDRKGTQLVWLCLEEYCWHRYFSPLTKQRKPKPKSFS